ncbi:cryptochrome/photolyase family protein [Porticoccus sp.]|uniref:cryptochrome/photolyase family protein n=1 Tax=Porticoccus sp. TaxID=2024853 RepID=UPI003F6A10BE
MQPIRHLNLILGDQLNRNSTLWDEFDPARDRVWMAEVRGESTATLSSKQRTVQFLSAMRHFADALRTEGIEPLYIPLSAGYQHFADAIHDTLKKIKPEQIRCVVPGDNRVLHEMNQVCIEQGYPIIWLEDSHFISTARDFASWAAGRKSLRMEYWYRLLRKRNNILLDYASNQDAEPCGGQWNYDKDNRRAFGKAGPQKLPQPKLFSPDPLTQEVMADVVRYLPDLPGELEGFQWPVTREDALLALTDFIEHRLARFGDYQDAMWQHQPWLYHSRLAASLNLKLLDPREVIAAAEAAWRNGTAPLNAVEGFIRQILGWREYVRGIYWLYRDEWPGMNALNATRPLPDLYWTAQTDMRCMQQSLQQVLSHGYGHHIQRLMVTGLFALLLRVRPEAIHQWYLAMYVDAVAWVETPNTLGMSQYADGGILASKPYIASGAYIDRMSNYCTDCPYNPKQATGKAACPFTTLYWVFISEHQDRLKQNPRLAMQVKHWHNKSTEEKQAILTKAKVITDNPDDL